MVARPHILLHRTRRRASGERFGREHVIEPPPDVALAHVAPRRPPCEEPIVVGIERAADVDETAAEDRSTIARSSGSWPIARGFRSFGCTSRSVRATFM